MIQPDSMLTTRNATVADLAALLQTQQAAKFDVVTPARHVVADRGRLRLIEVGEPRLTPDGVTVGEIGQRAECPQESIDMAGAVAVTLQPVSVPEGIFMGTVAEIAPHGPMR